MKILGIAASPRKAQTTEFAVKKALSAINAYRDTLKTDFLSLAGKRIDPCTACGYCRDNFHCSNTDDDFTEIMDLLKDDDIKGIILASPVYMGSMTAQAKAFLDRTVLFRRNGFYLKNKIGGAIAVGGSRNGGQELTIRAIHNAMLIHDMIIVGDGSPTAHFGGTGWQRVPGGMAEDTESCDTFTGLGNRIAELVLKCNSGNNQHQ